MLHQNEFPSDPSVEVDKIAKRALTLLARTGLQDIVIRSEKPTVLDAGPLVERLYQAAVSQSRDALGVAVKETLSDGASMQEMTSLLVPRVVYRLGKEWEEDTTSFGVVTIACARLQAAVRQLESYAVQNSMTFYAQRLNCLVVVPVGAQHTLGAVILSTQLRQAGSHVQLAVGSSMDEMSQLARAAAYDTVMISASIGQDVPALRALVEALRSAAKDAKIIIGGGVLEQHTDLARLTGADFVTNNWKEALNLSTQGVSRCYKAL